MKRGTKVIIFLGFLILLIIPLASAGFFSDFKAKITGKPTQGTPSLNITIGNSVPSIDTVNAITAFGPIENSIISTTFNFTATDADGGGTINISSAIASFQLSGITRQNASCINVSGAVGNDLEFTCTVGMYYFDEASTSWVINVTVKDKNGASVENTSTTFQYNSLPAMVLSPTALTWLEFGITDTNQESNNSPVVINNTGNDVSLTINVTGFDLQGEETITQFIYATNFSIEDVTTSCTGTAPVNATSTNVTSTILQRGNNSLNYNNATSGQEELFFCVKGVLATLSPQSYSSAAYNSGTWNIDIIT